MGKSNKNSDKEKMERYRQEVAKKYKDTFEELKSENRKLMLENAELKSKFIEMESTIERLESINSELQKCIGLSKEEVESLVKGREASERFASSIGAMSKILSGSSFL